MDMDLDMAPIFGVSTLPSSSIEQGSWRESSALELSWLGNERVEH